MTESPARRIVALGECMVELREVPGQVLAYAFAGDTLNVATYLRRLLPPAEFQVDYATALGDDPLSERMLAAWRAEGIGTSLVRRLPGELPGLYWIHNRADGEREFFYWRSTSAARRMLDGAGLPLTQALRPGDWLYLSAISLAILPPAARNDLLDTLPELRGAGVQVAFDNNVRPRLWPDMGEAQAVLSRVPGCVDLFITSVPDESALFGARTLDETVRELREKAVPEWLVRGEPGVTASSAHGHSEVTPIDPARVVDTTGAGDAFDAAYLSARLLGLDAAAAVRAGHALARIVVQHRGAIVPLEVMPGTAELHTADSI